MRAVVSAVAIFTLAACTSNAQRSLRVEVREQETQSPVERAQVRVVPHYLFVPVGGRDFIVQPGAEDAAVGWTDAAGVVDLPAPIAKPFEVVVLVPFSPVEGMTFDRHPVTSGPTEWIGLLGGQGDEGALIYEVRLSDGAE